jgi:hypothetical protein
MNGCSARAVKMKGNLPPLQRGIILNRISAALKSFFSLLFAGKLPADVARAYGYSKAASAKPAAASTPSKPQAAPAVAGPSDGAVQILAILQRDARLVDFLMEDISSCSDEQVGAAVRDVQSQAREAIERCLRLVPVVDGVEGVYVKTDSIAKGAFKLMGNVPPSGKAAGGLLRHKGWKADKVDLPAAKPADGLLAPAEIEIE